MEPIEFDESNSSLRLPEGATSEGAPPPLAAWQGSAPMDVPVTISCWRLTREELEEIARTGVVWLTVMGRNMPPVWLGTANPFVKVEDQGL